MQERESFLLFSCICLFRALSLTFSLSYSLSLSLYGVCACVSACAVCEARRCKSFIRVCVVHDLRILPHFFEWDVFFFLAARLLLAAALILLADARLLLGVSLWALGDTF